MRTSIDLPVACSLSCQQKSTCDGGEHEASLHCNAMASNIQQKGTTRTKIRREPSWSCNIMRRRTTGNNRRTHCVWVQVTETRLHCFTVLLYYDTVVLLIVMPSPRATSSRELNGFGTTVVVPCWYFTVHQPKPRWCAFHCIQRDSSQDMATGQNS